jgi:hypothetical protein
MCDPISLTVAAAAVTMGGQYMQGQGAYTNAKYQEAAAKANANLAADQAKQSTILTEKEAAQVQRQASDLEGHQRAAMGANNIDSTFGSAVSVQRDTKMIAAEDVGNIYEGGEARTRGYLIDAYNSRLKASAAHSAAKSQGLATGLSMVGTALGAASQIGKIKAGSAG